MIPKSPGRQARDPALEAAMAALAVATLPTTPSETTIESILAAFAFSESDARRWWTTRSDWIGGRRPLKVVRREPQTVYLAVVTAVLAMIAMLRSEGHEMQADGLVNRLRAAGAPGQVVDAATCIFAEKGTKQ